MESSQLSTTSRVFVRQQKEATNGRRPKDTRLTCRQRINLHERYEVEYWASKWHISREQLAEAVNKVGPMSAAGRQATRKRTVGADPADTEAMALSGKVKTSLDETRTLMLGAQILLGFQFNAVFRPRFDALPPKNVGKQKPNATCARLHRCTLGSSRCRRKRPVLRHCSGFS
jgi:Protein of unknown function (DUF3606)